jgi:hypothetical protein
MPNILHPALQVMIALLFLAILIMPDDLAEHSDLEFDDKDRNHIP